MGTHVLPPERVVERLVDATNAHDLEGIVGCFASDYHNETPAHPARGFEGHERVRRTGGQTLAAVPDITVSVLARATAGRTVWSEWEQRGTRPGGAPLLLRGVMVFTVGDDTIAA